MENIFFDIGLVIIVATIAGFLTKLLRQPLIPAYIFAGILMGPVFHLITNSVTIKTLSEIGIAFLLFLVGLEIDFKKLASVAKVSIIGGLIQIVLLFNIGFLFATYMHFTKLEAAYIGLVVAFSSTAVVVKLLSDKNELDTIHARIVLGILLIEDIVAVLAMSILNTMDSFSVNSFLLTLAEGVGILVIAYIISKYLFPAIFKFAARSQELLFLTSLTVMFVLAMVFNYIGFSIVIGSFIAGVVLGNLPYTFEIASRAKILKDFFATIFFVALGLEISSLSIGSIWIPLLFLLVIVILIKPLITMILCNLFGYTKRPAFLSAVTLTQISEFSLIIVAQGYLLGHVSESILTLTVALATITVTSTSYMIKYEHQLFSLIGEKIRLFENVSKKYTELDNVPHEFKPEFILCGYNRIGYSIVQFLQKKSKNILVIDFNPEVVKHLLKNKKVKCLYGDISDYEVLNNIGIEHAKVIISTDPELNDNLLLLKTVKVKNKRAIVIVTANQIDDAMHLYSHGADYVIIPHLLGGEHVSSMLNDFGNNFKLLKKTKQTHIKELKERMSIPYN